MAERRAFLLRIEPELYDALQRWAGDELRSLNAQIEYVLRREVGKTGRMGKVNKGSEASDERSA